MSSHTLRMKAIDRLASKHHGTLGAKLEDEVLWQWPHLEVSEVSASRPIIDSDQEEWRQCTCIHKQSSVKEHKNAGLMGQHGMDDTFAFLLRRYGRTKALSEGQNVHAQIIRLGSDSSTFLANCLIEMYGNCGSMEEAQSVFEKITNVNVYSFNILLKAYGQNGILDRASELFWGMPHRDIVSWNAMIAVFSHWGRYKEAFDVYSQMLLRCVKPDKITFVCVLNTCSNLASVEKGYKVHAAIIAHGLELNVMVGTTLVNMYGKCGSGLYARNVFDRMPSRDTVCWNAMIAANAQNRHSQEALFLFNKMQLEGISPNNISFVCALDACASLVVLQEGKKIHAAINNCEVVQDVGLGNTLLNMYGKCGSLLDARVVFERMPFRDIVSWNAMITVLTQNEQNNEALGLYDEMQVEGIRPNNITFVCALNACASLAALEEGQEIHNTIIDSIYAADIMVENALINMYGKCSNMHSARKVFLEMSSRDVISWNSMITALAQNGYDENAFEFFQLMLLEALLPDDITFVSVLDACARMKSSQMGQGIHISLVHLGYQQDVIVGTALVSMYGKCGDLGKARSAFDKILPRNLVSWNSYMAVQVENGQGNVALDLFRTMLLNGVMPDKVSFACVIDACASLAMFEDGKAIHYTIIDFGYEQDLVVGTALINMYGKCGSLLYARSVFDKMRQWDLILCNALIGAFSQSGHGEEALYIFFQMQLYGIKPDQVTFISILTACSHTGEIEEGRHFFVSMSKDHDVTQSEDHFVCMIDILGRAGHLDEAEGLINSMPFEKAAVVWLTLLGACQRHGDIERGLHVAKKCFESDPEDAAPYVMMSNIYAAAGRWVDKARELQNVTPL